MKQEKDPNGFDPHEPGAKLDDGKPQIGQFVLKYFPDALEAVAKVSEYGAKKYTPMGWASVPDGVQRYSEALLRHQMAAEKGEQNDPGSDLLHRAQVAWNALAALQLFLERKKEMEIKK